MNKLSPENLFVPSQKNVRSILARYNLPLTRFLHATHGIENLTLLVWSQRKKYVLRIYPQKKKSRITPLTGPLPGRWGAWHILHRLCAGPEGGWYGIAVAGLPTNVSVWRPHSGASCQRPAGASDVHDADDI